MSDNLTARIEALEAKGYDLHELHYFLLPGDVPGTILDTLLTALEQAEAEIAALRGAAKMYANGYFMQHAIGAARLKLAEQRMRLCSGPCHGPRGDEYVKTASEELAELRATLAASEAALREYHDLYGDYGSNVTHHVSQLEAALAAQGSHVEELDKENCELIVALAAERAKRCETCEYEPACNRTVTIKTRWTPLLDSCSEYQPRNQVPNVAQQGSERDAEGTGEGGE